MTIPLLSIVIPVYNSEQSLPELFDRIDRLCKNEQISYEIICVNDGSVDKSWYVLETQAQLNPKLKCINLKRNRGQQAATLCGVIEATGEFIATLDDDLEYNPEDLITLLFAMRKTNVKLMYGVAENASRNGVVNKIASAAKRAVYSLSGLPEYISSMRMMRNSVPNHLTDNTSNYFLFDALIKRQGKPSSYVNVKQNNRKYGQSGYRFTDLVVIWVRFLYSSSRFGPYSVLAILGINILLLLKGYLISAMILGIIALISTYLTFQIRWIERRAFDITEKVNFD